MRVTMAERWNISNSALRGGLGTSGMGSGSNTGSNGIGNGISLTHPGVIMTADGVTNTASNSSSSSVGLGISVGGLHSSTGSNSATGTTSFSVPNGESGILRRTGHYHHLGGAPDNFDDLLVFGYSCKVFRDDERARFIDQGRHLIPWMGDNQLKIDRYDARGALHDLTPYEPPPGGYQDRLSGLTAAEQKAEQLCEEERYYSLYNNEVEEEMFQEEARKRETLLGNQVPFNYDAPLPQEGATVATVEARTSDDDQDDDPYKVPKGFEIPPDIPLPESMKEHTVIEKTAKFIASQGGQMEILLKTKQANNPLFDFLNQSGRLFRYYRHVLLAFRTNQYPILSEQQTDEQKGTASNGSDSEQSETAPTRPKIIVPAIKYKPSVDCAYTQLISKITGAPIPTMIAEEPNNVTADGAANVPGLTSLNTDVEYYPEGSTASVEVKKVSTGLAGLVQYDSDSGDSDDQGDDKTAGQHEKKKMESPDKVQELAPFQGIVPPLNVHNVIDRTAIYVAKNGYSFEEALRAKNDARFVFLNQAHEYYPYYAYRVRQRMNAGENGVGMQPPSPPAKVRMETENGTVVETTPSLGIKAVHTAAPKSVPAPVTNIQHQKLGAPVSFSLVRKPKEDGGGAVKTMPGLGSDEEEEVDKDSKQQEVIGKEQSNVVADGEISTKNSSDGKEHERSEITKPPTIVTEETDSELFLDGLDVLEATSPPSSVNQRSEREPADAKEKQAERKKRANMFVNLIKHVERKVDVVSQDQTESNPQVEKLPANESTSKDTANSEEDEGSIHSIRSTTLSPKETCTKTPTENCNTATTTTIIEDDDDDDDDDVVLVSETRPKPIPRSRSRSHADYLSDTQRSGTGTDRRSKKKKSKSHHRSTRVKKKSKKKSRSRSVSRSERSSSRRSRSRKRSRSRTRRGRTKSRTRSSSEDVNAGRGDRAKRLKKSKRATRSRSISRSRSRSPTYRRSRSRSRSKTKRSRKRNGSSERHKRKHRSRSRSSRRKSDSEAEERGRRDRGQRRREGHYEYDERYPPARARYWDC
ncbi:protein suppressor of white apricot [Anopheles maculipalpis]|uniref:protein suppressor of white apricot n=1 Tax=Anopheles maculipalpis TaxID=1496333 RepID=UPI0021590234|nr:protein suppressor of white apricot [Anopheles maculipalpis]